MSNEGSDDCVNPADYITVYIGSHSLMCASNSRMDNILLCFFRHEFCNSLQMESRNYR